MNRVDILKEGLHRAIPTGGNTEYSRSKWQVVAEELDKTLMEYESQSDPNLEMKLRLVLASNDGANPKDMASEIMKELTRTNSLATK